MQTVLFGIGNRIIESISNDDDHYTTTTLRTKKKQSLFISIIYPKKFVE